jgi:hypothetical protein
VIVHTLTFSELRFFKGEWAEGVEYDASCVVMWESPTIVWLRLLQGTLTRKMLRELLDWLISNGIEEVKANRGGKHSLPLSVKKDSYYSLVVKELAAKFNRGT